jgi:hypothetical protein
VEVVRSNELGPWKIDVSPMAGYFGIGDAVMIEELQAAGTSFRIMKYEGFS